MSVPNVNKERLIRLRFIDAVFREHGRFSRSLLTETFGISEITATRDLGEYKKLNKEVFYENSSKQFLVTEEFDEVGSLWEGAVADTTSFLKAIEMIYDVKIGVQPVPTFGVHKV
jgi:hypothetical protein